MVPNQFASQFPNIYGARAVGGTVPVTQPYRGTSGQPVGPASVTQPYGSAGQTPGGVGSPVGQTPIAAPYQGRTGLPMQGQLNSLAGQLQAMQQRQPVR